MYANGREFGQGKRDCQPSAVKGGRIWVSIASLCGILGFLGLWA